MTVRHLGVGIALCAGLNACAIDGTDELATESRTQAVAGSGLFLVAYKDQVRASDRKLLRDRGATVHAELDSVVAIEATDEAARAIGKLPTVAYVEADLMRFKSSLADAELEPSLENGLYGLITTGSTDAHQAGFSGTGLKLCVADTSIDYNHPDIAPNYAGGIDTVGVGDSDPINSDGQTHGTHVAGTIAAALNGTGVRGVAYSASLYHARVLGPSGGTSSDIMQGVQWLADQGCHVVNLSLGGGGKSRAEEAFFAKMRKAGVLVVAASGNDGAAAVSYPAGYPVNIAVGAVDVQNQLAVFSNKGPTLDVVAPGVLVLSTVPPGTGFEAGVTSDIGSFSAFALTFSGQTPGVERELVPCGLGLPGDCPDAVAGNIALMERGSTTFATKVQTAMSRGAVAVVIYNNQPGSFVGSLGTAGSWIPAVSISQFAGQELLGSLGNATVESMVSSYDHYDGTSMAAPHATAVLGLVLEANGYTGRSLRHAQYGEQALKSLALDLGPAGFDSSFGVGLVQAP
jgi:subtilisin family serine protease